LAHIILHNNGAYNIFSSILDAPIYEEALTLDELKEEIKREHGDRGMRDLPDRLKRAHKYGNSGLMGDNTLEEAICINRAGENETQMMVDEFIEKYMTLKPSAKTT